MNRVGVTQRYSEDLLNQIFQGGLVERNQILHGYAILIDGKFWTKDGKFLWQDRRSLTQSFYNRVNWIARRTIYRYEHHSEDEYAYPGREDDRRIWREFKRTLEQYHGFQIIHI